MASFGVHPSFFGSTERETPTVQGGGIFSQVRLFCSSEAETPRGKPVMASLPHCLFFVTVSVRFRPGKPVASVSKASRRLGDDALSSFIL